MNPVKVFVTWDGDGIGRLVGRARLADLPDEVRRLDQSINAGNELFTNWALAHGGNIVEAAGDEGTVEIGADHLGDIPSLRSRYQERVGATVSVGIGVKMSESSKALLAAKLNGRDSIRLYDDRVDSELAQAQDKTEAEKISDEYLNKADPGLNTPARGGGIQGPAAPAAPSQVPPVAEGSEHSDAEAAASQQENAPPQAEQTQAARNFTEEFHGLADSGDQQAQEQQQAGAEQENQAEGVKDLRSRVASVLEDFRAQAPLLEGLKTAEPKLYRTLLDTMQSMVEMGRQLFSGDQEPVQKSELEKGEGPFKTTAFRHRKTGAIVDSGPVHYIESLPNPESYQDYEEGYLGHDGRFYNRKEAAALAGRSTPMRSLADGLQKGDVVRLNPPAPTGKRFRANAEVVHLTTPANSRYEGETRAMDPIARNKAQAGAVPHFEEPHLVMPAGPHGKNVYSYTHLLPQEEQDKGLTLAIQHTRGEHDDGMQAAIHQKDGRRIRSKFAYPSSDLGKPWAADLHDTALVQALTNHGNWVKYSDPVQKSEDLDKVAPPGFDEETMQGLKQKYGEKAAFKIAWAAHNRKQELDKAALEAGKTGRHDIILPVGAQKDPGPNGGRNVGQIKIQDPTTGKTKWRQVRSGLVMSPDGTPTSSRNPGGSSGG